MVSKILKFGEQKGSSLSLPVNGLGGSRATFSLVAHFALQNTASNPAEKKSGKARKAKALNMNSLTIIVLNFFSNESLNLFESF